MHLKSLLLPALLASLTGAYHIAVTDQNSKTVRVFPRDAASWNKDAIYWSWTADGGPWPWTDRSWADISEVKIRKTADRGWVALVATSAGKVGMIDITSKRSTNIDDVVWQASPEGNPHSIERIPYKGAFVVASSATNRLTVYVPEDANDVNNLSKIKKSDTTYTVDFAHGVLWDPAGAGSLWALGRNVLVRYSVAGAGLDLKLVKEKTYKLPPREGDDYTGNLNGHDLQKSYKYDDILLLTHTRAAFAFNTTSGDFEQLIGQTKLKSLTQTEDGEYIWIRGEKNDMGQYVSFSSEKDPGTATDQRGWSDAEFYKARIYNPEYE
jgi:hypothetical protein